MNAAAFVEQFQTRTAQLRRVQFGTKPWTELMAPLLGSIGESADFYIRCHPFACNGKKIGKKELLDRDFVFFSNQPKHIALGRDGRTPARYHPVVVIEHENDAKFEEARSDLWKACVFVARLRVFIGYGKTTEQAKTNGKRLRDTFDSWELPDIVGGEVLIIMGPQTTGECEWDIWVHRAGHGWSNLGKR